MDTGDTKCSQFMEHNPDGKEDDATYMPRKTDIFEMKGAGGWVI